MIWILDVLMVMLSLTSMYFLNFNMLAVEGLITGTILGFYFGWRLNHGTIKRSHDD